MPAVSAEEIDEYLRGVEEPKRSTLHALRRTILDVLPYAEQGISYGMPAFRLQARRSPASPRSRTTSVTCRTVGRSSGSLPTT
jgi:hypothetical protein